MRRGVCGTTRTDQQLCTPAAAGDGWRFVDILRDFQQQCAAHSASPLVSVECGPSVTRGAFYDGSDASLPDWLMLSTHDGPIDAAALGVQVCAYERIRAGMTLVTQAAVAYDPPEGSTTPTTWTFALWRRNASTDAASECRLKHE